EQLAKHPQQSCIEPGRFTLAKSVIEVEADLHLLAERERFDITDGDGVLEDETGVIGAQRQTVSRAHGPHENLYATAQVDMVGLGRIAISEAVEFAEAHGGGITGKIEHFLAARAVDF